MVLGSHMLEICASIAAGKPSLRNSSAGYWRQSRSRFGWSSRRPGGPAVNASLVDMGNRFRLIVNEVEVVAPDQPLPKLPVARAVVDSLTGSLKIGATAWIYAAVHITPVQ